MRSLMIITLLALSACGGQPETLTSQQYQLVEPCNAARETCEARLGEKAIELTLGPDVQILHPFAVRLSLTDDIDVHSVTIDFDMVDMDMGVNRYHLEQSGDSWSTTATIPICVTGRMDWIAKVTVITTEAELTAGFPFTVRK